MAHSSQQPPSKPRRPSPSPMPSKHMLVAAIMVVMMALTSPVSQASMAPVYGAVPVSVNHQAALVLSSTLGFAMDRLLSRQSFGNLGSFLQCLGIWACWIPVLQSHVYAHSSALGIVGGPIVHGLLSCHSLLIPGFRAVASMTRYLISSSRTVLSRILGLLLAALFLMSFIALENMFARYLPEFALRWDGLAISYSPVVMQLLIAFSILLTSTLYTRNLDWRWSLMVPALLHTFFENSHLGSAHSTSFLTAQLMSRDWVLHDRRWSTTGYLSVLDNTRLGYRVLRCDHSLLGGEWLLTLERRKNDNWKVTEPIYSVFEMLEAVRLIEVEPTVPDRDAKALIIGLGIGTAPKAFIAHGIDTTVVELDPVVHHFATSYFDLPRNHTPVLRDAIAWVTEKTSQPEHTTYDYILHDVFTGGAEPLALFTDSFVRRLRQMLAPRGVIALNYAGDLSLPLTRRVLYTINEVFEGRCRAFRDSAPPSSSSAEDAVDFVNLVVFCRNEPGPVTFRRPTEADFLRSKSREQYLLPSADKEISLPGRSDSLATALSEDELDQWRHQQIESATRHWAIMRTVLPDFVWELW